MLKTFLIFLLPLSLLLDARETPAWPAELEIYDLHPAPVPKGPALEKGDKLAICGDSITEQRMYSLIIETYLTACLPEMEITCRQYGWSGEQAGGFLNRMIDDVLRFKPTIATTCYGMNDFRYVPFDREIAGEFLQNQNAITNRFIQNGCRVIIGSPSIIDSVPHWVQNAQGTQKDLNLALAKFRNIALDISTGGSAGFADIYRPMLLADYQAKKQFGDGFKVAGKDGVHPGWAGHVIMAYAFLKAMGVDGDIGTITWNATTDGATTTPGHEIVSRGRGKLVLRSTKLPFSPGPGDAADDNSIRAGLALVPFDDEFNRLTLKIVSPRAKTYKVNWGAYERIYTADELIEGVSLSKDFQDNPLVPSFDKIWKAVAAKQGYETRQIKSLVHGPEGQVDIDTTFALTEKARARFEAAVLASRVPVEHEILFTPVK